MQLNPVRTSQLIIPAGMIDLGVGQPSPSLLPLSLMATAAADRLGSGEASLLAYGAEQGDGHFRIALAQFLSDYYAAPVDPAGLFVTAGASQGLDLICTLLAQPGDAVFVEEPSYFLALRIFRDHRLKIIGLPMDADGLMIEAVEEKLAYHQPALLYTVCAFHNPTGVTLSAARREALVRLSRERNLLIVADEVYHLLAFTTSPPPPLGGHADSAAVLSLGSFSKIMAPGLRLGWVQTGRSLMHRLVTCGLLDSGGGLNPFTSGLLRSAITLGLQRDHLVHLKAVYAKRMLALTTALRRHLPEGVTFQEPAGGFFVWLKFPEQIDTAELLSEAKKHGVGYQPGKKFSCQQGLKNFARVSVSYYASAELEEGVLRLARVFKDYV
jgi:2-aminoadipate transaminase